jgi:hypothetical protein
MTHQQIAQTCWNSFEPYVRKKKKKKKKTGGGALDVQTLALPSGEC